MKEQYIQVEGTDMRVVIALAKDGTTFRKKLYVWYEEDGERSAAECYELSKIMEERTPELEKGMVDRGLYREKYIEIKKEIQRRILEWPKEDILQESRGLNSEEMLKYVAELIREEPCWRLRSGKNGKIIVDTDKLAGNVFFDDKNIYILPRHFKKLAMELEENGYSHEAVIRELDLRGLLKKSKENGKERKDYLKRILGKDGTRCTCIKREGYFKEIEENRGERE